MEDKHTSVHGQWSSRWAFILAATAAAVGLGNIWKFPYITGQNGGGAFVLIYIICTLLIGIPLMMSEILLGRYGRQNPANTMKTIALEQGRSPGWKWIGVCIILAGYLILSYYCVIAGWSLAYTLKAAFGHFHHIDAETTQTVFNELIANPWKLIFWQSLIVIGSVVVISKGLEHGIERTIQYLFPLMFLLLLVLVFYGMFSGHFKETLSFLFKPDLSEVSGHTILVALGQAFFSLSLATGSIMMYGAYLPRNASVTFSAVAITIADTGIALLAGLAIFPIVFSNHLTPSSGPGLIFETLPIAFGQMPYGSLFATLFFVMLVFAAFTSSISLLEPTVAWLVERWTLTRVQASLLAGSVIWFLGLGTVFSFNLWENYRIKGLNFFECLDYLTANLMLPIAGLFIAIFTAWRIKRSFVREELQVEDKLLFKSWRFILRYISPLAIIVVFLKYAGVF